MTLKCNIQGTGASSEHSEAICGELAPAVTAAGSTQATATLLRRMTRHKITGGTGGVIVPPGVGLGDNLQYGDELEITNSSGVTQNVYPPLGGYFYGHAVNAPVTLDDTFSISILCYSVTEFDARYYNSSSGFGTGSVTSVALTAPTEITVAGSPITTTGTFDLTWTNQTQAKVFASPASSTGTPSFRALVTGDLPAGTGTVTSVGLTAPNIFSVAGSPVTTSGTLAMTLATQSANLVWAGPATGSPATPTFRALVAADFPAGVGTVTSVGMTGDNVIYASSVTGSPVTTTGTLVPALKTQTANTFLAGPTTGSAATPTFRAMVAADLVNNGANPTASVGASAVNGSATTWMRSDGAPALAANMICDTISGIIDGGGAAIASGAHIYIVIPFNCTIVTATSLADQSGSVALDWWKCTYSAFDAGSTHPVVGDKITASAPPSISSATKSQDSTLTGWTTSLAKGDILAFVATGDATNIQRVTGCLTVNKT